MRFRWEENSFGRSGLVAIPEKQDTTPVFAELWVDQVVETVPPDRIAVAAALVFHECVAGDFRVADPVSVEVARAIEALDPMARLRVDAVHTRPQTLPADTAVLELGREEVHRSVSNQRGAQRNFSLSILRSDRYSGGLLSMDGLSVASNAWLHGQRGGDSGLTAWMPYLAVAVLLSQDLGAGAIALPPGTVTDSSDEAVRVRALCNAGGLALS